MLKRLLRKTIIRVVSEHMIEHMEEELEETEMVPEYNVGFIQFTQLQEQTNDL